ncbi:protein kinase domain-containing protein [Nocardiopsis algeriensis]|uniref:protein kinase domain-containing protein n=1 Tax=Nocardiopsis algeriensis TaxID=1478215 RepID=UPI003B4392E9
MRALNPDEPTQLGGYRLIACLGSGGMGRVYLGIAPDGRPAAVRTVRAEYASDRRFRARFARDAALARRTRSRFTPPLLGHCLTAPRPWVATAYVVGPSLRTLVEETGPLAAPALRTLARCLAEALDRIHAAGAVHRGLDPDHVLVDAGGPRLVRLSGEAGNLDGLPAYTAPEQLTGGAAVPGGDMFSLGGVLLFAATGRDPFGGGASDSAADGAPATVRRVLREPADLSGIPEPLHGLVGACLDKLPQNRPSAADVLAELGGPLPEGCPERTWLPAGAREAVARAERAYRSAAAPVLGPSVPADPVPVFPDVPGRASRRAPLQVTALLGVLLLLAGIGVHALLGPRAGSAGADVRSCPEGGLITEDLAPPADPLTRFDPDAPLELSFSPDDSVLAVSHSRRTVLWDWEESEPLAAVPHESSFAPISPVAFSPDGCLLARSSPEGAVVTDLADGRSHTVGANPSVRSVAFSPDGSFLAVASQSDPEEHFLRLYDTGTWEPAAAMEGSGGLGAVRYSLYGGVVAGGEADGGVATWQAGDGLRSGLIRDRSQVGSDAFDLVPDGSEVLILREGRVLLVDPATGQVLQAFAPAQETGVPVDVFYSAASGRVFAVVLDPVNGTGNVAAWQYVTGHEIVFEAETPHLYPAAMSQDGSLLAGLEPETGRIAVYDTHLELLGTLEG